MPNIDLYLIHGYLGSGKTTIIKKFLDETQSLKRAVLQNEFGDISIDGILLKREDLQIKEVNNGSIFCSCKHDQFIQALLELGEIALEIIFIEASGISDPSTMEKDMDIIEKLMPNVFNYLGNICIIDAENFLELAEVLPAIKKQVRYANLLYLNKIDLITDNTEELIKSRLRDLNSNAEIITAEYGQTSLKFDDICEYITRTEIPPWEPSLNEPDNRPNRITLTAGRELSYDKATKFFTDLAAETYRIKGFLRTNDGWIYLDGVNGKIKAAYVSKEYDQSKIVVILKSKGNSGLLKIIEKAWNDFLNS